LKWIGFAAAAILAAFGFRQGGKGGEEAARDVGWIKRRRRGLTLVC
jgi:hypothetical protein